MADSEGTTGVKQVGILVPPTGESVHEAGPPERMSQLQTGDDAAIAAVLSTNIDLDGEDAVSNRDGSSFAPGDDALIDDEGATSDHTSNDEIIAAALQEQEIYQSEHPMPELIGAAPSRPVDGGYVAKEMQKVIDHMLREQEAEGLIKRVSGSEEEGGVEDGRTSQEETSDDGTSLDETACDEVVSRRVLDPLSSGALDQTQTTNGQAAPQMSGQGDQHRDCDSDDDSGSPTRANAQRGQRQGVNTAEQASMSEDCVTIHPEWRAEAGVRGACHPRRPSWFVGHAANSGVLEAKQDDGEPQ